MLWTGTAALLATAAVIAPLAGPRRPRGAVLFFRPDGLRELPLLLALGMVLYPAAYGLAFDALHNATFLSGAALGALHAVLLLLFQAVTGRTVREPAVTVLTCLVYGIVMGFLYVTP